MARILLRINSFCPKQAVIISHTAGVPSYKLKHTGFNRSIGIEDCNCNINLTCLKTLFCLLHKIAAMATIASNCRAVQPFNCCNNCNCLIDKVVIFLYNSNGGCAASAITCAIVKNGLLC